MPKFIQNIHDRINFAIKKGLTGYISPTKIDDEVHAESMNFWRHYVTQFEKSRILDVYMRPFQFTESVTIDSLGKGNYVTKDFIFYIEGVPNPLVYSSTAPLGITNYATKFPDKYGSSFYVTLASASGTATVKVELDGVVLYNSTVAASPVIIPFTYQGQSILKITTSGFALTTFTITEGVSGMALPNIEIKPIANESVGYRVKHPVKVPTASYPVTSNFNQAITIFPAGAFTQAILSYLKRPTKPIYAFTTVSDRYVYDDTNSVDFEWPEPLHPAIMEKVLSNFGINMRATDVIQYSNQRVQQQQIQQAQE